MPGFIGPLNRQVSVDKIDRAANTVEGSVTLLPRKDVFNFDFSFPEYVTTRGSGVHAPIKFPVKNGKQMIPDGNVHLATDVTSGAPSATSAYAYLGRPEAYNAPTRTILWQDDSGMTMTQEFFQDKVAREGPDEDGILMTLHNIVYAGGAVVITGY